MYLCKCGEEFEDLKTLTFHVSSRNPHWPRLTDDHHGRIYDEDKESEKNKDQST